jgi:hypothetical protein
MSSSAAMAAIGPSPGAAARASRASGTTSPATAAHCEQPSSSRPLPGRAKQLTRSKAARTELRTVAAQFQGAVRPEVAADAVKASARNGSSSPAATHRRFKHVCDVQGGITGWEQAGLPVTH